MLLNKDISSFEEYFWTYNQSYKSIAEYRQELITGWDDNASKELNIRYFTPHAEDSENSLLLFQAQINCLREIDDHLTAIESLLTKINAISREIESLLNHANIDIKKSYYSLNEAIENKHEAIHWKNKTNKGLNELEKLKKAHNNVYKK